MYPSQWFASLGMLWFPWIFSTVLLLLQVWPVRGITQAAVHGWYLAHVQVVLLGLLGLASVFYFLPVLRKEALHSRALALFTFVGLILFGGWVGLSYTVPLPAWMGAIGKVMTVFLLLPVWAAVYNVWRTRRLALAVPESRYFSFSLLLLLAYAILLAFMRVTPWGESLNFTVAQQSLFVLLVQGFSGLAGLGAAYFILPRLAGRELPAPGMVKWHFGVAAVALILIAGALWAGGFLQGARLRDAQTPFTDVAKSYLMSIRVASLGETLWILGALLFGYNVVRLTIELVLDQFRQLVKGPVPAPTLAEGRA
jgi:cytochrome c oxidase cbb3-type subunit 1